MKLYRPISLILAIIFAITGLLFLIIPDKVLVLFNSLSPVFGLPLAPVVGFSFYLVLAVAYMYLVTILAYLMFKHPDNRFLPFLLAQSKLASAVLSIALFLIQGHYLVYFINFLVDGVIGLVVLSFYYRMKEKVRWASH